jgi:hypothetical protein
MKYVLALFVLLISACGGGEGYFRLEEYGEGWKLEIKEDDETFRASWIEGSNRSAKLISYADAPGATDYYIVNTLYLEIDAKDTVVNGRLKRVVLPQFEQRTYYEQNAEWFRVLEGTCTLDEQLKGQVRVRCQGGYEFDASVEPMPDLETKRPKKD